MSRDRHARASEIFLEACERPPAERARFVADACAGDAALAAAVEELLAFDTASAVLDEPLVDARALEPPPEAPPEAPPEPAALPRRIGRFEIDAVLGEGGMGVVYRARQANPQRTVALKVLRPGRATPELVRRLEYEAHVLARLQHPAIAQIYEAGAVDTGHGRQPFFAMELVDGPVVLEHAERAGLDSRRRLELLARIGEGVHHAHQKGVIHRDLKPGNILVDASGEPKILDFGIARLTDADIRTTTMRTSMGQLLGTIPYMSPEQVAGDPEALDLRSDVYALGVIGYELLTGQLPLDLARKPIHEAARLIREAEPRPLGTVDRALRGDVETIIGKAMEKDKERRYQSALELVADIRRLLADEPIDARPASALYQMRKFARRNRVGVGAGLLVLLLVIAGGAVSTVLAINEARAKTDARRAAENADVVRRFFLDVLTMPAPELEGPDVTVVAALRRAQEEIETALPDRPDIRGDVHAEMAATFARLGETDDAERHGRTALAIRHAEFGETDRRSIASEVALAGILLAQKRRSEAIDEAARLLATAREKIRATYPGDPDLLVPLLKQEALSAFRQGRIDDAERLTRETLDLCAAHLGPADAATLDHRQNLAVLLRQRGRHAEAALALEPVVEARRERQGASHPRTISSQRELAGAYRASGAPEKAEAIYRALLPLQEARSGGLHPETVLLLNELAFCLKAQEQFEESAAVYRDALDRTRRGPDPGAFQTAIIIDSLAIVLTELGQLGEAAALHAECVAFFRAEFPSQHRAIGRTLFKLTDVLLRDGRTETALPLARDGIAEMEGALADDDPVVTHLRTIVARALYATGHPDDARSILDRCLRDYAAMDERDWLCERSLRGARAFCETAGETQRAAGFAALLESESAGGG